MPQNPGEMIPFRQHKIDLKCLTAALHVGSQEMIKYLLELGYQHLKNEANNHHQIQLGAVVVLFLSHFGFWLCENLAGLQLWAGRGWNCSALPCKPGIKKSICPAAPNMKKCICEFVFKVNKKFSGCWTAAEHPRAD